MTSHLSLLLFSFVASSYGSSFLQDGSLNIGLLAHNAPQGRAVINHLSTFIKSHTPAAIDVKAPRSEYLALPTNPEFYNDGIFYRTPLLADPDGIHIDITTNEDCEVITGSRAATIDISESKAVADSTTAGWRMEGTQVTSSELGGEVGAEVSVSAGFFGVSASASVSTKVSHSKSSSTTNSQEGSGENAHQREYRQDVSKTFECPPFTICSVQTWTYNAKLEGSCPRIPIVDVQRFFGKVLGLGDTWRHFGPERYWAISIPLEQYHSLQQYHKNNISLPAVHGRMLYWSTWGSKLYNIALANGLSIYENWTESWLRFDPPVTPHKLVDKVWWPSPKEYNITYKINRRCELVTPLFQKNGQPKRSQVVIERPVSQNRRSISKRQEAMGSEDGTKITILSNDIGD